MRVLMVCLGNICRSPMADGLLRKKSEDAGFDITVDSAGTSAFHVGEAPDKRMQQTAKEKGVDISFLRARQFIVEDYDSFDIIYAMDESNYQNILALARNQEDQNKVKMILNESFPGQNMSVPDPYFGGEEGFYNVFELLDNACDRIIDNLKND